MKVGTADTVMSGAKEYLQSVQRMERIIEQKRQEIAALTALGATDHSGPKVQSGPSRTTENRALRYGRLIEELETEIDRYVERRRRIVQQIQDMDNVVYMELLYKRYVEGKKLELIAVEMNLEMSSQVQQSIEEDFKGGFPA